MTISNEHKRTDIIQKIQLAQSQRRELLASMKQRQKQQQRTNTYLKWWVTA